MSPDPTAKARYLQHCLDHIEAMGVPVVCDAPGSSGLHRTTCDHISDARSFHVTSHTIGSVHLPSATLCPCAHTTLGDLVHALRLRTEAAKLHVLLAGPEPLEPAQHANRHLKAVVEDAARHTDDALDHADPFSVGLHAAGRDLAATLHRHRLEPTAPATTLIHTSSLHELSWPAAVQLVLTPPSPPLRAGLRLISDPVADLIGPDVLERMSARLREPLTEHQLHLLAHAAGPGIRPTEALEVVYAASA